MATGTLDERFYRYQVRAIRRFQRHHGPKPQEESAWLALKWVNRNAAKARSRWEQMTIPMIRGARTHVKGLS